MRRDHSKRWCCGQRCTPVIHTRMNTRSLHRIRVFWNLIFCVLDIHIVVRGKPASKHGVWHLNFVRLVWRVQCIQLATRGFFFSLHPSDTGSNYSKEHHCDAIWVHSTSFLFSCCWSCNVKPQPPSEHCEVDRRSQSLDLLQGCCEGFGADLECSLPLHWSWMSPFPCTIHAVC